MNEREALKLLKKANRYNDMVCILPKSDMWKCLIKALEEVQQYREIGTVEELEQSKKYVKLAQNHGTIGQVIDACAEYEEIGTVEKCRTAVEKQKAKRADGGRDIDGKDYLICPNCCAIVADGEWTANFCPDCGQALDWSGEE